MPGNSIGQSFTLTTFGESHGPAIGGIIDGCPPHLPLSVEDLAPDLARRRPGSSAFVTQRNEPDHVEILSGVFEGKTTGTPIGLLIRNQDAKSKDYAAIANLFRPGHADYTYQKKYGIRDYRGGGRSSARETAVRVAAGAVAKKYLAHHQGISIRGCLAQIGSLTPTPFDWEATEKNPFFWPSGDTTAVESLIEKIRKDLDSIGASVLVEASGVPAGLGEPVFDRLDADIAKAMLSINATKGVEIGDGFKAVSAKGSEFRDHLTSDGFASNHAGGVLGGISSGQTITATVAFKPTSSIPQPVETLTTEGTNAPLRVLGRHDPCVGIRAVPICEAMLALTLADHLIRWQGQCAPAK